MSESSKQPTWQNGLVEMEINKIRIDERRGEQVIVLREKGGARMLPIIIGISEVTAIKMTVSGIAPPRPLTHDLLNNVIAQLGAHIARVVIYKLELSTFFAQLVLQGPTEGAVTVDARPSDGVALALRADAPIFVADAVLDQVASGLN